MDNFTKEYKSLNDMQKKAVDLIDGPVLVVAGPGTGKTQLLSMRVANILNKTDTDARNILCLTFTNKATINMKDRINRLTNGRAKDVTIKTFHSFAGEIMNLNPSNFWNGARLTTVPEAIADDIIKEILSKLPLDNPLALKFAGQFTGVEDVKNGLKLAKESGLTPEKLSALIIANLAYIDKIEPSVVEILSQQLSYKKLDALQVSIMAMPSQGISNNLLPLADLSQVIKDGLNFAIKKDELIKKTTHTGKWKKALIQTKDKKKAMFKERERNQWWLELANVYDLYKQELYGRGYYDYSDMIIEVISKLEQDSFLRSEIQENYHYVMIDEFQDSNSAQMRLAHLISVNDNSKQSPNLMVVGDDDQSIYKFNGAELANMLTFQQTYPDAKVIVLTENYRSSQEILDTSSKVIEQATDRLTLRDPSINKVLTAKNPPQNKGSIKLLEFSSQEQQFYEICKDIQKEYQSGNHSISVLARNSNSLRQIAKNLQNVQVPIVFHEQNNILENEVIISIHAILSLLNSIEAGDTIQVNYWLSQVLRHPMWGLNPYLLWDLASNNRSRSWLDAIINDHRYKNLENIVNWLFWLNQQITIEPLQVIINYILGLKPSKHLTSPLSDFYLSQSGISTKYVEDLSAINLLLSLTNEFSKLSSGILTDLINLLENSNSSGKVLQDETVFVTGNSGVELLTVHKAKGLEFDSVYLIDLIDNNWRPKSAKKLAPQNLPLQPAFDDEDDYIRLLYVAMTRAKRQLMLSYYTHDEKGKEVLPTPLINSVLQAEVIKLPTVAETTQILENSISWPKLSIDDEALVLSPRLENFNLSASSLIDFLDVSNGGPDNFKEKHLLSLPGIYTSQMAFGTAIHGALEYGQILTNNKSFKTEAVLVHYEKLLNHQNLPNSEFERYKKYGKELLEKLFESDSFWLPKNSKPEQSISQIIIGDAKLYGKIDRIDTIDNTLSIIDYKTGKPLSSLATKDQTKIVKAWRYKTQLIFYSLLIKNHPVFKRYTDIKCKLIFVEASTPKELVREYSPTIEDLNTTEEIIKIVWNKILNLDFPDTSAYEKDYAGIQNFIDDLLNNKI